MGRSRYLRGEKVVGDDGLPADRTDVTKQRYTSGVK